MISDLTTDPPEAAAVQDKLARVIDPPKAAVFLAALVLIITADLLFWEQRAGISLAVFAVLIAAASTAVSPPPLERRRLARAGVVLALALLPVIELAQPLSLLFLFAGMIAASLIAVGRLEPGALRNARLFAAFPFAGVVWFVCDGAVAIARFAQMTRAPNGVWAAWGVPLAFGLVFLLLFAAANPLIESWTDVIFDIDILDEPERLGFWLAIAMIVWPFVRIAARSWPRPKHPSAAAQAGTRYATRVITPAAVRNSLILFNGMFAVQTALDAVYLWGGVALPEGMTYAAYAHRGAYPLVATALLAGVFVVAATTFVRPDLLARRLVYLWIAQNILLLLSSVLRLDLYVSAYDLTGLRVAAFIWMGMVCAGFGLIVVRMVMEKTNAWLFKWNTVMAIAVLYVCCFVNFTHVIASYNVRHSQVLDPDGRQLDAFYICGLGPHALPAIMEYEAASGTELCANVGCGRSPTYHTPDSWRAWGFRNWRLEGYLAAQETAQGTAQPPVGPHG